MKTIFIICIAALLVSCSTCQRPIQLCPESCKPVVDQNADTSKPVTDAYFAFVKRLGKQKVFYWLTDSAGQPVTTYRYKHDRGIFESDVWPLPTATKENPQQISMPIILKHDISDVVIHLIRDNDSEEEAIELHKTVLEHHNGFDVIYIK